MPGTKGRVALLSVLAVLTAGAGVAVADATISAAVGEPYRYTATTFSMVPGERATFQNPEDVSHNVTAARRGPDGRPLFRSRTIGIGSTPVEGVQYLGTGTYDFVCTVHSGMRAKLQVAGAGAPAARPDIEVAVPAQPLGAVRRTGRLKVRVRALTASRDVALLARKGPRRIGFKGNVDLAAGVSRVIRLSLSASGRKALAGLGKAAVSVRGSVPFGSPDLARRTLR
jgi:plastocyanin